MASVLHGSARTTPSSSSRVPSVEREQPGPCRPLRPEREDRAQMAQPDHTGRRAYGSEEADEHGADAGRGGDRGGVPAEDPAAAGRCPGLLARRDPSPQSPTPCTDACNATASPGCAPIEETREQRKRFKTYEIGYVHIDSCELRRCRRQAGHVLPSPSTGFPSSPTSSSTTARARWRARPSSATPWRVFPL